MHIEELLAAAIESHLVQFHNTQVEPGTVVLQPTRKEFPGDVTLNVFPLSKLTGKAPDALAAAIGEELVRLVPGVAGYNVVKGFLNIEIADRVWLAALHDQVPPRPMPVHHTMVEYSSPNTNKPLHLGHVRNNLLGFAVAQILEAAGEQVTMANLINDRGIHICKSMVAWQLQGNGATPESTQTKGDHFVGEYYVAYERIFQDQVKAMTALDIPEEQAKHNALVVVQTQQMLRDWEANDTDVRSLWKQMNGWVYDGFAQTYARLGVRFDKYYYESETYLLGKELIAKGLADGVFYQRADGAICVDLTDEGLDEKVLLRSDGTSVYITQDLGTAYERFTKEHIARCVYVVGNEQDYHFKVLKLIFKKMGMHHIAAGIFHLSYGMIDLPEGRMKSREGNVVDADDLMEEMVRTAAAKTEELGKTQGMTEAEQAELHETLGMGALKYFLLRIDPKKRMTFNPEESIDFHGNTGPFVQYTHARIKRLLNRALAENMDYSQAEHQTQALLPLEQSLLKLLARANTVLHHAAAQLSPAVIANYAFEVAQLYNRFYQELSIFNEEVAEKKALRLAISAKTARTIAFMLGLLGIKAPERM